MAEAEAEPEPEDGGFDELRDVAPEHRCEVEAFLGGLAARRREGPGGLPELRDWLASLSRYGGFSRAALLQLCRAVTHCLLVDRGPWAQPTQEALQQAFVRMGGLKQAVHVMLPRLDDPGAVAACVSLLDAGVQGVPLAAEAAAYDRSNLRLVLRAIDRHSLSSVEVALAGCRLVAHLVAPLPWKGAEVAPARAKAYRDTQRQLAAEAVLDTVVELLFTSVRQLAKQAAQVEAMEAEAVGHCRKTVLSSAPKKEQSLQDMKESVERTRGAVGVRQAWRKLGELEATAAKVQDVALQALLLLAQGNAETTTVLVGVLITKRLPWEAEEAAHEAARRRAAEVQKSKAPGGRKKGTGTLALPAQKKPQALAEGERRQKLDTMEALAKAIAAFGDVLRGRACRDRPELAAKACRLVAQIGMHHHSLVTKVAEDSAVQSRELAVRFGMHLKASAAVATGPAAAPFALLEPIVSALTLALRTHIKHVSLLTAALGALVELRAVAVLIGGVDTVAGDNVAVSAWQELLTKCQKHGELSAAGQVLRQALSETELANKRMATLGIGPDDLGGDGSWLTPRMRCTAELSLQNSCTLAGDAVAVAWRGGDPARVAKRAKEGTRSSLSSLPGTPSTASAASQAPAGKSKTLTAPLKSLEEPEPPPLAPPRKEWARAIGYGDIDEQEFNRLYRPSIEDALSRSFSMPTMRGRGQGSATPGSARSGAGGAASGSGQRDALDKFLNLTFVESLPGKLRARCLMKPQDRAHAVANLQKMKELLDPQVAAAVMTSSLCKDLRKSGCMLPKYGIKVSMRKGRGDGFLTGPSGSDSLQEAT